MSRTSLIAVGVWGLFVWLIFPSAPAFVVWGMTISLVLILLCDIAIIVLRRLIQKEDEKEEGRARRE